MRKVDAIFRPGRLEAVIERLQMIGAGESFVSEVRGFGRQGGRDLATSGSAYRVDFVVKVRLEWYGDDEHADAVARAIAHAAHTGKFGDGRIFVGEVDGAIEL